MVFVAGVELVTGHSVVTATSKPSTVTIGRVRFLTWNLAMLERSAEAPQAWQQFHIEAAIRDEVLAIEPDIVCWQELPRQVPFVETLDLLPATTRSHSGNLACLVTHELNAAEPPPAIRVVDDVALLATFGGPFDPASFTVANVHLEPGPGAADRRLEQISRVVGECPTQRLLIVGDTNMRLGEGEVLFQAGFTGDKPPHATWDSRRNKFRFGGNEFSAYFTRWFASPGLQVDDVTVHRTPVEFQDTPFFLSDHYALSGTLTVV
jgi:endonuclease/exonuclease/phosphatase family metal-dependent hydrolase